MWHKNTIVTGFGPNDYKTFYIPDTFKFNIVKEVILSKDCYDEQEIHYFDIKKPQLKKGTKLKVKYKWHNFYGAYYRCFHKNGEYDIRIGDCETPKIEVGEFIGLYPDGKDWRTWDPRSEHYQEINLEKYIEKVKQKLSKKEI